MRKRGFYQPASCAGLCSPRALSSAMGCRIWPCAAGSFLRSCSLSCHSNGLILAASALGQGLPALGIRSLLPTAASPAGAEAEPGMLARQPKPRRGSVFDLVCPTYLASAAPRMYPHPVSIEKSQSGVYKLFLFFRGFFCLFWFFLLLFLFLGKSHPRRRLCDAQMFFFTPRSRQVIHRISKDLKGTSDFTCISYPCSGSPWSKS